MLTGEAAAALHMALKMNDEGKSGKALKLFQQALKLSPNNPDVLNSYGEFLEHEKLIEAENLYTRALINDPSHSRALQNRQRTFPKVQQLDQDMLARIDNKRYRLYEIPEENAALQRAMKEAYYQHIHHTTAIEGNTMTLSMARAVVETKMAVDGKSVLEHNEILGLDEALKYINTTLVQEKRSITVKNVIEIHRRVLGHAHPLEAGQFRNTQVFVGNHVPPHPTDVEWFMEEFDAWLSSPTIRNLHPIEFAALAHYRLVYIHPFTDGNGRTGRLLMNLILMRAGFPPVTIKVSERHDYYACLQDANRGDVRPFIRFVAKCAERTLDEYLSATTIYPVKHYTNRGLDYRNHLKRLDTLTLTK
jgi:Fic family protein